MAGETIKVTYDPSNAKKGLAELDKSLIASTKNMDAFGATSTKSAKVVDNSAKSVASFGDTAKRSVGGVGQLGSVISAVGTAAGGSAGQIAGLAGGLAGAAEGAVSAASALGPLGIAIAGATTGVGFLVAKWREAEEAAKQAQKEALEAAKAQQKLAEEARKATIESEIQQIRSFRQSQQDFLSEIGAIEKNQAEDRLVQLAKERDATKDLEQVRSQLVLLAKVEAEEIEKAKTIAEQFQGSEVANQRAREKFQERYASLQRSINSLKEREKQIIEEERQIQDAALREAEILEEKRRRQQEDAHRERLRQLEEERRKTEELAKEHERLVERDATRLLNSLNNGAKVATQLDKTINKAIGGDSGEVKRGVEQGPLNFAGSGGLASYAQGLQAATVAGAGFHLGQLGQSRFQFGGIIPRGGIGGGGGGGVVVPAGGGAAEQSLLEKLAAAIDPRRIAEQIAKNREADIDQARAGALAGRGNIRPGGDEARAINRRFDREEQAARRGAFRGDVTETERANAVAQIADAQAQANGLQGDALDVFRKALKLAQEQQQDTAKLQQDVKTLEAVVDALSSNRRSHALRAGRRP